MYVIQRIWICRASARGGMYNDIKIHGFLSIFRVPITAITLRVYIYLSMFSLSSGPYSYNRWSRPQTLSVLGCQASRMHQEPGIRRRRGVSRPIARSGDTARFSKLGLVARGLTISRLATTVVDRRCRYSAVEELTQNTVDCVKSTTD